MHPLKPLILCCLLINWGSIKAQDPGSHGRKLSVLSLQYQQHKLEDTEYMKAVDSIAPLLLQNDSLPQRLSVYRQVAFNDKKWGIYRARYYTYLALNAYNCNRLGSAIYYSEKNNEERIKAGLFEKEGLSHSDLFAISVFLNDKDYNRVFARYDTLRHTLLRMPGTIASGTVSPEEAFVAFSILNTVVYASAEAKDSSRLAEGFRVGEQMLAAVDKSPEKYRNYLLEYRFLTDGAGFKKESFLHHYGPANEFLQSAIRDVCAKGFPLNLQPSYTESTYTDAFNFFFSQGRMDSARRYLDLVKGLGEKGVNYSSLDPVFLPEGNSRLLARDGQYQAAYNQLLTVYRTRDSAYYAVSSDKDNNLYALAEAENTRAELLRMEAGQRKAERFTLYLSFLLVLLVLAGFAGFRAYRSRGRQRLLNLQLNLARNFHDQIGPMLVYAGALVKKEMEAAPPQAQGSPQATASPRLEELKTQLTQIMESVRAISHDLKSNRLGTVDAFYKETILLLEKIRRTTSIDFNIRLNNGSRVLSNRQHTHLKNIMNELIGNSIKHAECSRITILIRSMEKHLHIGYSDDGKGFGPESPSGGIGIRNIEERVTLLNGRFQLYDHWPKGYSIEISIPFV